MIDHIGLHVCNLEKSKAFYQSALAPLGYKLLMEFENDAGLGVDGKPDFWISPAQTIGKSIHVAFVSEDRATVDAFYKAALAAGGTNNGAPGLRPMYHPDYYGAFVHDLDGHNIEVVCHKPEKNNQRL